MKRTDSSRNDIEVKIEGNENSGIIEANLNRFDVSLLSTSLGHTIGKSVSNTNLSLPKQNQNKLSFSCRASMEALDTDNQKQNR